MKTLLCFLSLVILSGCVSTDVGDATSQADEEGFVPLFNGKNLDGWLSSISTVPQDWGAFTVNEEEQAIHVYAGEEAGSEQPADVLYTVNQYSHFILKLEYKWLDKRFAPRADVDRDAGVLFHITGDMTKIWPHSVEMQIGESDNEKMGWDRFHSGDLFVIGSDWNRIASFRRTGDFYDPEGEVNRDWKCYTKLGTERPHGEWNEIEVRVYGSEKAVFILNGEVTLEVFDMEQRKEKDDPYFPLQKGHIGFQAEWAELLYRNIRIKELPIE